MNFENSSRVFGREGNCDKNCQLTIINVSLGAPLDSLANRVVANPACLAEMFRRRIYAEVRLSEPLNRGID